LVQIQNALGCKGPAKEPLPPSDPQIPFRYEPVQRFSQWRAADREKARHLTLADTLIWLDFNLNRHPAQLRSQTVYIFFGHGSSSWTALMAP
jgi:hypothetical protein